MKKKLLVLVMCLLMMVSFMFVACEKKTEDEADTKSGTKTEEKSEAKDSETSTEDVDDGKLFDEPVTITVMRDENNAQPIKSDSVVIEYLKTLNVYLELEAIPKANYTDKKSTLIVTDKMPDIMLVSQDDIMNYSGTGVFVNLSDYMDQMPNFKAVYEQYPEMQKNQIEGSVYGFQQFCRWQPRMGQLPVIRMDLIEEYNLEVPTSFDELYDVLAVFKENNPDKIPLVNRKGGSTTGTQKVLDTMAYPLGSGSGLYYDADIDGGRYVYGPASEQFKEVLTYLNRLYEAKLLDQDYATNTKDIWKEKMSSGRGLAYFDNGGFANDFNMALQEIEPGANLQPIMTLTNSLDQTRNFFYGKHWNGSYIISDSSEVKEEAIKFMDWCFSDEGCDIMNFGVMDETFELVDGSATILDSVLETYATAKTNSPSYEMCSNLGVGLLSFVPYIDQGAENQMKAYLLEGQEKEDYIALMDAIENDPGMREPSVNPPLSSEDAERVKILMSSISDMLAQEYDKFIMGIEPIENYDEVIARVREAGAAEIEEIYNNANEAYK